MSLFKIIHIYLLILEERALRIQGYASFFYVNFGTTVLYSVASSRNYFQPSTLSDDLSSSPFNSVFHELPVQIARHEPSPLFACPLLYTVKITNI